MSNGSSGMGVVANVILRLVSPVRQTWEDYRVGRMMRINGKNEEKEPEQFECKEDEANDREEPEQLGCKRNEIGGRKESEQSGCRGNEVNGRKESEQPGCKRNETQPRPTKSLPSRGWKFDKTAQFPWRLRQVVQEESNWRGTWVLEVKDMVAMDWGTVEMPEESGGGIEYPRRPTRQLPFTPEMQQDGSFVYPDGGQDDLMVWLGKP